LFVNGWIMDKLLIRAITAFYRSRAVEDDRQPDHTSTRSTHLGKGYVVLRATPEAEPLAVYRCMNRGELKRLKRWPAELIQPATAPASAPVAVPEATPVLLELVPVPRKTASGALPDSDPDQAGLF
jgi:hypothetical protein